MVCLNLCVFQVRVAALQNLVKIMSLYYQYMETYMGPALFAVSPASFDLPETLASGADGWRPPGNRCPFTDHSGGHEERHR